MNKKYIELQVSEWLTEDYTDEIKYINKDDYKYNLIEIIEEFYINIENGRQENFNKILEKIMIENGSIAEDYELLEEDYKYILDYKEEFNNYITNEELTELCNELSVYIDTVGYSDWCYYIAPNASYHNFASDLFNGYNFYGVFILDEKGLIIDQLADCYITTDDELIELVQDYFSIDEKDILLIDNEESRYFDFKKVTKQVKEYEFLNI